tara:strand:+ start:387 stop:854 length:468 start_codon:yes stop_codon:yes gene_type:complete
MGKSHDLATLATNGLTTFEVDTIKNTSGTTALTIDSSGDLTFSGSNTVTPTDSGWITPTLNSYYTSYASPYGPIRYRKIGNIVSIEGITNQASVTSGQNIIFNLPEGYRPAIRLVVPQMNGNLLGRIDISNTGDIIIQVAPSSSWISLYSTFMVA